MKPMIRPWILFISSLIISGCSSSGPDSISSHKPFSAGIFSDCLSCHSSQNSTSLDPLATNGSGTAGKHILHVTKRGIACLTCHLNYTSQATHVNGTVETGDPSARLVYFDSTNPQARWINDSGPQQGSCSSLACHGPQNPDWYGADETLPACATCHIGSLDPLTTNGTGTDGKHILHVTNRAIACTKCHFQYTDRLTHMNGNGDTGNPSVRLVYFDQTNPSGQWTSDTGPRTGQCSSAACHGAGIPDWYSGNSTLPACMVCHAGSYDPAVIDETTGGKHSIHVGDYTFVCMQCHYGYTDHLTHMNGTLDTLNNSISIVYFNSTNSTGQWNSIGPQAGSCSNLYCHSDATSLSTGTIQSNTTLRWDSTGFPMACSWWTGQSCLTAGCHIYGLVINPTQQYNNSYPSCSVCHGSNTPGTLTQTSYPSNPHKCYGCHEYPPTYAADAPKSNSHWIHAGSSFTCNYCHYATTTNNTTITDTSKHANGSYNVIPDTNAFYSGVAVNFTYAFDIGGGKCSNISCHIARGIGSWNTWGGMSGVTARLAITPYPQLTTCYQIDFFGSAVGGTPPYTYSWSFSDGTVSTDQNPVHTFPAVPYGSYSVTLTVRDANRHANTASYSNVFPNSVCQGTYPYCTWLNCW
jgi:predicted CxxxxCH...CXXCH cytochrome family protein